MLNRKTNNFNDFSRYYSEENQELLEKNSKFDPYIMFFILFSLIILSYFSYNFLFQRHKINTGYSINTQNIVVHSIPSPISRKEVKIATPTTIEKEAFTLKQKKLIEKLVIEKIIERKIIEKEKKSILVKNDNLKTLKKEKTPAEKIIKIHKKAPLVNRVKKSDKENLYNLSSQLEEIINRENITVETISNKRIIIVKKGDSLSKIAKRTYGDYKEFPRIVKENAHIIHNPNIIYVKQKLSIPIVHQK